MRVIKSINEADEALRAIESEGIPNLEISLGIIPETENREEALNKRFVALSNYFMLYLRVQSAYNLTPLLYHGTDWNIASKSREWRKDMFNSCVCAINALKKPYEEPLSKYKLLSLIPEVKDMASATLVNDKIWDCLKLENFEENFSKVISAALLSAFAGQSELYKYGDFYMTSGIKIAEDYAKTSYIFGEIGRFAYALYKGIEILGLEMPEMTEYEMESINKIAEQSKVKPNPVIFFFPRMNKSILRTEKGERVSRSEMSDLNRYPLGVRIKYGYDLDNRFVVTERDIRMIKEKLPNLWAILSHE